MITKNIRTHRVIMQDGRELSITSQQYAGLRQDKIDNKATDMFILRDIDTNAVIFDGEFRAIKEFREIKNSSISGASYVCLFGTRHPVHDDCKCGKSINFISQEDLAKKIEWTNKKIEEIGEEGMEYFLDLARFKLKKAIEKGNIGPKFIKEYAHMLMRKEYNCPYK